tara:strand:+ start:1089 stop:1709 length:621 start_codon:yes stop_codon:yes gene_type:complete
MRDLNMVIGFDFDNTIIDYSNSFKILAKKKKYNKINSNLDKNSLKDFLIKNKKQNEWTIIQGEVYGKYITRAELYKGFIKLFRYLLKKNIKIFIVSHKTKYPYLGKKINLRKEARKWIQKNIIYKNKIFNFSMKNVYFENSIEKKINRIVKLKCNIFIDDLPQILNLLPKNIIKFLFNPNAKKKIKENYKTIESWAKFYDLIKKYE